MFNTTTTAECIISEALYGKTTLDMDEMREAASDLIHDAADNACTYYSDCIDIIDRYSSHDADRGADDDADGSGSMFKPSQWREAAQAYAFYIARAVIEAEVSETLDNVAKAEEALILALAEELPDDHDSPVGSLMVSLSCPHGWAAHDREDEDGICYWVSGQVDGCNALAVQVAGVWLSYCWEPKVYFSLLVRAPEEVTWVAEFGSFNAEDVWAERDDLIDHGTKKRFTKVIKTKPDQASILAAVAALNA